MEVETVRIYTDGAARGNPGHSASGFMVYGKDGKLLKKHAEYNGIKTNNFAEYRAVMLALEWCLKGLAFPPHATIALYSDSEVVVRQLNGTYKSKSKALQPLKSQVKELEKGFKSVTFNNVPREEEHIKLVDRSLNDLLDSLGK